MSFLQSQPPGASDVINFWQSLPRENFPELRKFSELCMAFWNDFRIRTSIFVYKTSLTDFEVVPDWFKFEEFSSVLRENFTPNIDKLVKPKETQKFH